jgi:predicted transposase YbfD/YdcC
MQPPRIGLLQSREKRMDKKTSLSYGWSNQLQTEHKEVRMEYSTTQPSGNCFEEELVFEVTSLYAWLLKLKDQRKRRGVRYPLGLILVMVILAKLGGEDGPKGICEWLSHRIDFLVEHLKLCRPRVPHPITISRVLGWAIDVEQLERLLKEYFASLSGTGQSVLVSIDGKTIRSTIPAGGTRGTHLLAVYLPAEGLVLMQIEVDRKENEIVVAPQILQMIDLQGKIVVGDALHTQRAISVQIVEAGGNYCWTVKDNQPNLRAAIERFFEPEVETPGFGKAISDLRVVSVTNQGHGRFECRTLTVCSVQEGELDWPGAQQVFKLHRRFVYRRNGAEMNETIYGITSLTTDQADARQLLEINRGYWGIENGLHYRRDVTLKEDYTRVKIGQAARVMATINNLVLNLIARHGVRYVPEARRKFSAHPDLALPLITQPV